MSNQDAPGTEWPLAETFEIYSIGELWPLGIRWADSAQRTWKALDIVFAILPVKSTWDKTLPSGGPGMKCRVHCTGMWLGRSMGFHWHRAPHHHFPKSPEAGLTFAEHPTPHKSRGKGFTCMLYLNLTSTPRGTGCYWSTLQRRSWRLSLWQRCSSAFMFPSATIHCINLSVLLPLASGPWAWPYQRSKCAQQRQSFESSKMKGESYKERKTPSE